jgi:ATP-dependent RNA helicase RhlE
VGIAQTGTGKTFAFGLPLVQRLAHEAGRALIIVPTRELAQQTEDALRPYASLFRINMAVFVGGASFGLQRRMLRMNPRILISTPGRLNDHLEQGTITLKEVKILVLDEADRMLDMGFKPQIDRILSHVPKERQTLLFSATMPRQILELATREMKLPLRIEIAPQGTAAAKIEQELIVVKGEEKQVLLQSLLRESTTPTLVFTRTKHGAKKLNQALKLSGFSSAEIHSDRSLIQRKEALMGFKSGKYRILIATDVASRGIDVSTIELVVNYDLPDDPADYVHRIGRTGRADRSGRAISFATPAQARDVREIEKLMRAPLKRKQHASITKVAEGSVQETRPQFRSQRRGRPQGNIPRSRQKSGGSFRR